jgi:GAF domain-containing protein/HPt (histidine-containing phosphotransfer) domain-containing protein
MTQNDAAQPTSPTSTRGEADPVLYQNDHARVTRRQLPDGRSVVVKQAIGTRAIRRLNHEVGMLKRLAAVDGVAHLAGVDGTVDLAGAGSEPNTLVLDDAGGVALSVYLAASNTLTPLQAAGFGRAVASVLAGVHKAGVIHKDICPANLLIDPMSQQPTLIDFNIAALLSEQVAEAAADDGGIAGTLSYMSPEQTGRTGRAPDQRSDLYSLGITLYELTAGRKPFESQDLLELVHDHLVRVPEAPAAVNPQVPQVLSDIVMRLLEKEPGRRYQSADGLAQDLELVVEGLQAGRLESFALGRFDYGTRLKVPARLVGRDAEIALLRQAYGRAVAGSSPFVLMSGEAGSGKSSLVDELRPIVAPQRGWFVPVRFTPDRQGTAGTGQDSLEALGRQLLAQPEDQLALYRARLLKGLEGHMGIGATLLPEFQMLLGAHEAVELKPEEVLDRTVQTTLALLRSVAAPERPLVLVYDDLQWVPDLSLRALDHAFATDETIPGLMVVCAWRSEEVVAGHPVHAVLDGWKQMKNNTPVELAVAPLAPAAAAEFVGTVLRLQPADATPLARALGLRAHGNPARTIGLLNALRDDGLLVARTGHWDWNADALRRYVGQSSPAELAQRIAGLPADTVELLQSLACLGAETADTVATLATGLAAKAFAQRAAPALDEGLLAAATGDTAGLRFPTQAVRQAALASLAGEARAERHLALAHRIAGAKSPALDALLAEQYLPAAGLLADEAERRRVVDLFEAAIQRTRLTQVAVAERYIAAAFDVLKPVAGPADADRLFQLKFEHHRAMFEQGRLEEGDAVYEQLVALAPTPTHLPEPTRVQIYALMNRRRMADAVSLGVGLMNRLELPKPDDVRPALGEGIKRVTIWYRGEGKQDDLTREEITDPRVVALTKVVPETSNPAYFVDPALWAWLALEAHRLWLDHGPSPRLMSSLGSLPMLMVGAPQDYRGAYLIGRHVLNVGETRGYEPSTSFTRCIFGISAAHWVDPIETVVDNVFRRARADLTRLGDESFVSYTYVAADLLMDCAPTLDAPAREVDDGLAFAARSNNKEFEMRYQPRRQFIRSLRGQAAPAGGFTGEGFDEAAYAAAIDPTSPTATTYHLFRALSAAIFGDIATLTKHAAHALPLTARTPGYYITALARVLQGLALAEKARALPAAERPPVIAELDACLAWLTTRAADAPENFLHLQRWLEAERAWASDTVWAAGMAFDVAVQEAALHDRPWHRALILERAGLFHLAHGMEEGARPLMLQACDLYDAWGAAGKTRELRRAHPFLRAGSKQDGAPRSTVVDTEMVDMMAVLRASQALSSETSLTRLTAQVGKVLGAITGATGVQLIVKADDGSGGWLMARSLGGDAAPVTVEEAGSQAEIPLSVFRYAERRAEVLVVDDVTRDDRFSTDPYAEKHAQCSLLMAPILKQGQLNAMLVLENTQRRNAFRGDRLDSVNMIAGQLSVSLDNALLYASLEKRVAERTAQLRQKTADINAMLQNMPQGVMTVTAGHAVHPEYSAYLATLLETTEIAGRNVMDLLFTHTSLGADALSQVDAAIGSCIGEDEMNYEFNSHLLSTEFDKTMADGQVKSLALSWSPICDDAGNVDKLMLCVRDVTELKRLEAEAGSRKRELQMIGEILAVSQDKFHPFVASARNFLEENRRVLEQTGEPAAADRAETINLLFRNMHTIKGNARTYGLLGMTNLVHVAEQAYDDLRKDAELPWEPAALLAQLAEVKAMLETYSHVNDTVLGRKGPGRRGGVEKFAMVERDTVQQAIQLLLGVDGDDPAALRDALSQTGRMLHMIGTEPLHDVLAGTLESLPSLARELGKEAPTVGITHHGIAIRTQASSLLKNLFTHLLRNSVDHGIEAAEARRAAGKPAAGHIQLDLAVDDGQLRITLRDDGRGLAIARIRQRALEQGLIAEGAAPTPEDVAQLIFQSGFSTAEQVTEVSGRGVGMDAVKGFIEDEGGSIEIRFLDDHADADFRAFETVIALPDKYAASLSAAMSFDTLCARMQSQAARAEATR